MNLLVAVEDFCVQKITTTAAVAGVKIPVTKATAEELSAVDPKARSIVLLTSEGPISQHTAILRYLAELSPLAELSGTSNFNAALVDQWLEFSWQEIGKIHNTSRSNMIN